MAVVLLLVPRESFAAELVGKDKIFIRFTNTRPDDAGILVRLNIVPNHNKPFTWNGKTIHVGSDGAGERDEQFLSVGVRKAEPVARQVFALLDVEENLRIVYPDCQHDFPPAVRRKAYAFVDGVLEHTSARIVP